MTPCECHCEIRRDGSGQRGRYLKALDPAYAPVDGRSLEDLLVFAKRYASQVRFYDIPDSDPVEPASTPQVAAASPTAPYPAVPNWREFFRRDLAVIAASIAVVDTAQIKHDYDELRSALEAHSDRAALRALFDPIFGLVRRIDRWHGLAIEQNPLRGDLDLAIGSTLREQVDKIRAYEEAFKHEDPIHPLDLDYSSIDRALWGLDHAVQADKSVYQGADLGERIRSAALYVDDVFHAFHGFMTDLVTEKSVGYMQFALEAYPAHQPHMALFIAFLELFRLVQEQMNGLTGRMLDFYYHDVLHLTAKPPIPDRVYVVFELAKDVVEYDVALGTKLKGGKDAAGRDLTYVTTADLVVNQAKVKELKNIFVYKTEGTQLTNATVEAIFARPVANSADGFGAKITDPSGKWPTFGRGPAASTKTPTLCEKIQQLDEVAYPRTDQARVGFAIASPQLELRGGNRLMFCYAQSPWLATGDNNMPALEIWLTGEKGWLKITRLMTENEFAQVYNANQTGIFDPGLKLPAAYHYRSGQLAIYLPVAEQAIVPFDSQLHPGYAYATPYPVAQVLIRSGIHRYTWNEARYEGNIMTRVGSINLSAEEIKEKQLQDPNFEIPKELQQPNYFDGLKVMVLQNETGLLPPNKPFDPFTLFPNFGKSFYIGSAEVFNKAYDDVGRLAVNIENTFAASQLTGAAATVVTYGVRVLAGKSLIRLCKEQDGLTRFTRPDLSADILWTPKPKTPTDKGPAIKVELDRKPIDDVTEFGPQTSKGFLEITLQGGGDNTGILSIEKSQAFAPLLQIKEVSLSYYSRLLSFEPGIEQLFHVYPFGVTEVLAVDPKRPQDKERFLELDRQNDHLLVEATQLLPQFTYVGRDTAYRAALQSAGGITAAQPGAVPTPALAKVSSCEALITKLVDEASVSKQGVSAGNNQYSGTEQEEGMLLIGVEGLQPLDTLSLLLQFAEGSAVDEDDDPPEIHWSYLTNNEWRPLKGENLVSDGTYGFQTTGIVRIDVPEDCTDNNTIVTPGLRWFCASVTEHSERIPMLVDVVAQAAEAQLQDNDNDPSHFDAALPTGSISKLATAVAEIGKVTQPFGSFDGKHREVGKEFYTRVSERLRHKGRAITAWDYEHLVLDRFPTIYKVKCITHTDPNCLCRHPRDDDKACCGPQVAPGHVLVVPISNLKNRNAVNPLQPKTSRRTLLEIEQYLSKRTSPFVHVHARNPVYEQILVFLQVQFVAGTNNGYFLKKLNDEIVHYLTPWAFDDEAEVSFAQKVYASAIINFIEERPYVDFISEFLMFVCRDDCCPATEAPAENRTDVSDAIARLANCCDAEALFAAAGHDFICEVIAQPSTARSILVSAPRHIIIPYEAKPEPSPCEKRAAKAPAPPPGPDLPTKRTARKRVGSAAPEVPAAKPKSKRAKKDA